MATVRKKVTIGGHQIVIAEGMPGSFFLTVDGKDFSQYAGVFKSVEEALKFAKEEFGPSQLSKIDSGEKLSAEIEKRMKRLSKQIIKGHTIETEEAGGGKWKVKVDGQDLPGSYNSNAEAMKEGRLFVEEHGEES
jgi:hypothetical protein